MSIKSLLKESFRIFRENIKTIIGLLLMIYLPVCILSVFADYKLNNSEDVAGLMQELNAVTDSASKEAEELAAIFSDVIAKWQIYMVVMLVVGVLTSAFVIAIIKMSADASCGCDLSKKNSGGASSENDSETVIDYDSLRKDESVRESEVLDTQHYFSEAVKLLPRYTLAILLSAVFIFCGLLLFVFPGIVAAIVACFVVYTVSLTPFKGRAAFVFSGTVLSKKPVLMLIFAVNSVVQMLLSEIAVLPFNIIGIDNIYVTLVLSVVLSCILEFVASYFEIVLAVAYSYSIRKTPALAELIEAGEKYEAEKAANKNK